MKEELSEAAAALSRLLSYLGSLSNPTYEVCICVPDSEPSFPLMGFQTTGS